MSAKDVCVQRCMLVIVHRRGITHFTSESELHYVLNMCQAESSATVYVTLHVRVHAPAFIYLRLIPLWGRGFPRCSTITAAYSS